MLVVVLLSMMIVTKSFEYFEQKSTRKIRIWTHQSCLLYLSRETKSHERPHWEGHADRLHYIVFALHVFQVIMFVLPLMRDRLSWETTLGCGLCCQVVLYCLWSLMRHHLSRETTFCYGLCREVPLYCVWSHEKPPHMRDHLTWETTLWCGLWREVPLYCVCSTGVPVEWWDATWPTTCPRHVLWRRQNATGYLWNGCKFITVTSHKCHGISNKWQFYCFIKSLLRLTRKHRNCGLLTVPLGGGLPVTSGFPSQRASKEESGSMSWCCKLLYEKDGAGGYERDTYRKTSNKRLTLVGNKIITQM